VKRRGDYNNPFFASIILNYLLCACTSLFVSVCILFGISGFWLKKDILVILDLGVFWSFGEKG